MTPFSAEQAFDARDDGEPIMIGYVFAGQILEDHDECLDNFLVEYDEYRAASKIDAADILEWLGY